MVERKKILVGYHHPCYDGFTAAWAAYRMFGDNAEYVGVSFQDTQPLDVDGRIVYLLDYCPKRPQLLDYVSRASHLTVLDHHISNQEECAGLHYCHFDMTKSGAGLAWDFFHPGVLRPALVNYVEDRDLWKWELPHSRVITSAIGLLQIGDFAAWDAMCSRLEEDFVSVLRQGEVVEAVRRDFIESFKRNTRKLDFLEFKNVPVVNASGTVVSDLLNQLAPQDYFAVSWHQGADGRYKYSLRSNGEFDVSRICARFGGGGHMRAAAFVSEYTPEVLTYNHLTSLKSV